MAPFLDLTGPHPARRLGRASECAGACVFPCSPAASYIYGHPLVVDGGLTVGQIGRMPESIDSATPFPVQSPFKNPYP